MAMKMTLRTIIAITPHSKRRCVMSLYLWAQTEGGGSQPSRSPEKPSSAEQQQLRGASSFKQQHL